MITSAEVDSVVSAAGGRAEPPIDTEPRVVPAPGAPVPVPARPDGRGAGRVAQPAPRRRRPSVARRPALVPVGPPDGARAEGSDLRRGGASDARQRRRARRGALHRAGGGAALALQPGVADRHRRRQHRPRCGWRSRCVSTPRPRSASAPTRCTTAPPRRSPDEGAGRIEKADLADQLLRHSMFVGAEPSPVGITAWSQPWVPMWLEWEAELELTDTLRGWKLDAVDLEPDADVSVPPTTTTMAGRSLLTTGAARTMAAAVRDFLAAEDALEKATGGVGDVPDDVETALAALAGAVENLDVVTATLDGIRLQLLGVDARDGFQRTRAADGTFVPPAPIGPPQLLAAGAVHVTKARLLDTFGRTLDLPMVESAAVPFRNELRRPAGHAAPAAAAPPGGTLDVPARRRGRRTGAGRGAGRPGRSRGHGEPGRRLPAPGPPRRVARAVRRCRHPGRGAVPRADRRARRLGDRARPAGSARRRPAVRPRRPVSCRSAGSPPGSSPPT